MARDFAEHEVFGYEAPVEEVIRAASAMARTRSKIDSRGAARKAGSRLPWRLTREPTRRAASAKSSTNGVWLNISVTATR